MPSERNDHRALCARAFTLVEMLTVIAIIGILAAILIPTIRVIQDKVRRATASADVSKLYQAATAYSLDFGAFPPDCTAFWTNPNPGQPQADNPFPGYWNPSNQQMPLNPNELLVWYLTVQYSTGQCVYNTTVMPNTYSYPATGYPEGYPAAVKWVNPSGPYGWTPSSATVVFSTVNTGPYFDLKAKQKTDVNANGYYEFMDPWGRPYLYRAYPQSAGATVAAVSGPVNGNYVVTLNLGDLTAPLTAPNPPYMSNYFSTNVSLANTTGSIQLTGFTSNSAFNGTYAFQGVPYDPVNNPTGSKINLTTTNAPTVGDSTGQYTFPLHNKQTCDIYSLGPYGRTRAASMPRDINFVTQEWKPTHGGVNDWLDPTSLDAWSQVWGTPGDGNDINSTSGNIIVDSRYQDNICNWQ